MHLKSNYLIWMALHTVCSWLRKWSASDCVISTPPSILIASILIKRSNPNGISNSTGASLSTDFLLPVIVITSTSSLFHDLLMMKWEHLVSNRCAWYCTPLIWTVILGSTAFTFYQRKGDWYSCPLHNLHHFYWTFLRDII